MTIQNFDANNNNFDSIDQEFGINTVQPNDIKEGSNNINNNQEEITMTNQQQSMTDIDREFGINDDNNNTNKGEITMDNNQKSSAEVMAVLNNNNNKTMVNKTVTGHADLIAAIGGVSDKDPDVITHNFKYSSFGDPNAATFLSLKINTRTLMMSWGSREYRIAPKLIRIVAGEVVGTYDTSKASELEQVIEFIVTSLRVEKLRGKVINMLNALVGTVLLDEYEISDYGVHSYNCASIMKAVGNQIDSQEILRKDTVAAFWTNDRGVILTNKIRGGKSAWTKDCLEAAMNRWGYAMPDKNNSKRAFVSDSLGVMGISADGMKSIVKANKEGKFFSRHSMVKHISAEVENPLYDGLVSEASGDRFAISRGVGLTAAYVKHPLISLFSSDGGIIARSPITSISNKRLRGSFNLDILLCSEASEAIAVREQISNLSSGEQLAKLMTLITKEFSLEGRTLQPGESISFAGQVIIRNENNVSVEISRVVVTEGEAINTQVRTLNVDFKTKVRVTDYNHKLRGQWLKGMSFRNDGLDLGGVDADIIINDNCVKNVEGVYLRMFANATDQYVCWCKDGEVRKVTMNSDENFEMGEILNRGEVDSWLASNTKSVKISGLIDPAELEEFKAVNPSAFTNVREAGESNGMVRISFTANVIVAPLVCAIELSSVAENFSVGRNLAPISSNYLSTFSVLLDKTDRARNTASNNIRKYAEKVAKTIGHCGSKKADAVFNLLAPAQLEALKAVLVKANKNYNPRDFFGVLAAKYPNGIKLVGGVEANGKSLRPWEVIIPTHLIKNVGGFDPRNGWAYDDNIKNTYAFLLLVAKGFQSLEEYHLVASYAMKIGVSLKAWKKETAASSKSLTKGSSAFTNHGMKVIANPEVGYEIVEGNSKTGAVSIPRVVLDESNPLVMPNPANPKLSMAIGKNGKFAKLIKDGDIVLVHRNPVIDLTPCVVKVSRNQSIAGSYVVAMPPSALVWSSHSDVDGDVLWLIPAKQIGITNLEQAGKLMSHPLVGKDIACETMARFDGGSLVAGIISKPNAGFALDELVVEYMTSDLARHNYPTYADRVKAQWAYVVELAGKTSDHYVINTGKGYQCMFNAYSKFVSDALSGNINQQQNVLVGIKATSFVIYEEWALSGYSQANETDFIKLDDQAKELLGTKKKGVASYAGRFAKLSVNPRLCNVISLCAAYAAMAKVQSMIENSNKVRANAQDDEYAAINLLMSRDSGVYYDAVRFGLFRTLTKGAFAYGDSSRVNPIFAKHYPADDNNPYQPVIAAWQRYVSYSM